MPVDWCSSPLQPPQQQHPLKLHSALQKLPSEHSLQTLLIDIPHPPPPPNAWDGYTAQHKIVTAMILGGWKFEDYLPILHVLYLTTLQQQYLHITHDRLDNQHIKTAYAYFFLKKVSRNKHNYNNNNDVHLSCTYQRPRRSYDTY